VDLIEMDCLIIGYTGNTAEEFSGLVLAALVRNRLRFVGVVYEGIPDEERAELASRMGALKRDRPFVKARVNATWLEPKLMCRVTATELKNGKSLKNAAFKEMLADAQ